MSVYKSKRNESPVQFLETAREIQIYTIRQLIKIPNRYKYYLAGAISELATEGHILLKEANSIYPKDKQESDERKQRLLGAYAKYQALVSQIGVAEEFVEFSNGAIEIWMSLISNELTMIKKILASDKERYSNLD